MGVGAEEQDELAERLDRAFGAGTSARVDRTLALIELGMLREAYSSIASWAYHARRAGVVEALGEEWGDRIDEFVQAAEDESRSLLYRLAFDLEVPR